MKTFFFEIHGETPVARIKRESTRTAHTYMHVHTLLRPSSTGLLSHNVSSYISRLPNDMRVNFLCYFSKNILIRWFNIYYTTLDRCALFCTAVWNCKVSHGLSPIMKVTFLQKKTKIFRLKRITSSKKRNNDNLLHWDATVKIIVPTKNTLATHSVRVMGSW